MSDLLKPMETFRFDSRMVAGYAFLVNMGTGKNIRENWKAASDHWAIVLHSWDMSGKSGNSETVKVGSICIEYWAGPGLRDDKGRPQAPKVGDILMSLSLAASTYQEALEEDEPLDFIANHLGLERPSECEKARYDLEAYTRKWRELKLLSFEVQEALEEQGFG